MKYLERLNSHKFQETIVYSLNDVEWNGENWMAPGVGLRTAKDYDVYLDELRNHDFVFLYAKQK